MIELYDDILLQLTYHVLNSYHENLVIAWSLTSKKIRNILLSNHPFICKAKKKFIINRCQLMKIIEINKRKKDKTRHLLHYPLKKNGSVFKNQGCFYEENPVMHFFINQRNEHNISQTEIMGYAIKSKQNFYTAEIPRNADLLLGIELSEDVILRFNVGGQELPWFTLRKNNLISICEDGLSFPMIAIRFNSFILEIQCEREPIIKYHWLYLDSVERRLVAIHRHNLNIQGIKVLIMKGFLGII